MLTEQQRLAVEAAVKILQMGGITAWFEARIIQDSDKKLNGRRVSSKRRTDLDRVLKVADEKRVGMLPDMRMELRMYATVASSRSVVMGVEQTPPRVYTAGRIIAVDPGRPVVGLANYSPRKNVERLIAEGAPEPLIEKARARLPGMPANPLAFAPVVSVHTCDARGPMRQREPGAPFVSTCSLCGEINDTAS